MASLTEVPVDRITPNPNQPRRYFDKDSLATLTASVRELGVLQPVLVRMLTSDRFELIAGERRWRAARAAGLITIPVVIRDVTDTASVEQALVENLHRQDLNPLEEAGAYQQLIEDFGLTHEALSTRVGRSRTVITNTLRLFQLPAPVQKMVADNQLSAGHARALLGTPDRAFQEALARRVTAEQMSVRATEDAIRNRNELGGAPSRAPSPAGKVRPAGLLELEEMLGSLLETRVRVDLGTRKGKLLIEFANLEDLERIYRVMATPTSDPPSP